MTITFSQKADIRPIAFVLHNQATGAGPEKLDLVIRPEDLTRNDTSRLTTHQTLGGAWADNFGAGLPTVTLAGHTGWGQGKHTKDGQDQFIKLHNGIFTQWHKQRAAAVDANLDPDLVKLIFVDCLDRFTWLVAPQSFVLKRNKARPLLSQYQIVLTYIDDASNEAVASEYMSMDDKKQAGLASLGDSIAKIEAGALELSKSIAAAFKPIQAKFKEFCDLTASVLKAVTNAIKLGKGLVNSAIGPLLNMASDLARAGANITRSIQSILSIPQLLKAQLSRVASAFNNAFCVLKNVFKARQFITNYDDIYGASTCSSTAGGKPISRFTTENPFPSLTSKDDPRVAVTAGAQASIARMTRIDVANAPPTMASLMSDVSNIASGARALVGG